MTQDDNGTSATRYVIEIECGWQIVNGEFKDIVLARVFLVSTATRWPSRRQKPVIVLGGNGGAAIVAAQSVVDWFKMGRPSAEEAKAQIAARI